MQEKMRSSWCPDLLILIPNSDSNFIIAFTLRFALTLRSEGLTAPTFKARRGF